MPYDFERLEDSHDTQHAKRRSSTALLVEAAHEGFSFEKTKRFGKRECRGLTAFV